MRWDDCLRLGYINIYLCAIKVEDYIIFLYEGSMYTRYKYYVYVEVYVNLQVEAMKSYKFSAKLDLWM